MPQKSSASKSQGSNLNLVYKVSGKAGSNLINSGSSTSSVSLSGASNGSGNGNIFKNQERTYKIGGTVYKVNGHQNTLQVNAKSYNS